MWVELTARDGMGSPIYVQSEHVSAIYGGLGREVVLTSGRVLEVSETLEELDDLLIHPLNEH